MGTIQLPLDFREFLQLLSTKDVRYLLIGGYAVGYHGYPRPTGDIDIWVRPDPENLARLVAALHEFGFGMPEVTVDLFDGPDTFVQFGYPPLRLDLLTEVLGATFDECYAERIVDDLDGVEVSLINRAHLKATKRATGRDKDREDLRNLP
jgi:hypothetical protein